MSFFRRRFKNNKTTLGQNLKESGNVFLMLFGAVGMVGVIGASTMTVMKGPVATMSEVTKRTIAENNMIAAGKLALIAASQASSDCDADNTIEPFEYASTITGFTGGGTIPSNIGVAKEDPWGNEYGYCVWDHGSAVDDAGCGGGGQKRLSGADVLDQYVLAIVSSGPDRNFDTVCSDYVDLDVDTIPDTPLLNKAGGSDDIVLGYTYAEASTIAGGLWLEDGADGAEISRDIVVKDTGGTQQFAIDTASQTLTFGNAGAGTGQFPSVRTDFLSAYNNASIDVSSPLSSDSDITTTADVNGVNFDASGTLDVAGATTLAGLTAGATTLGITDVTSLDAGAGAIVTTGTLGAGASTLGATGVSSLDAGAGAIVTTGTLGAGASTLGATGVSSLDAGAGAIVTTGTLGAGASTLGATGVSSLNAGAGAITTTGTLNAGTTTLGATTLGGNLAMGANAITGLADPTNAQDAATRKYVLDNIAAGTGYTETDPQVGDVSTSGKWCQTDGDSVECTFDLPGETDPQVGTLTNGKWCTTDGTDIDCTTNPPGGAGTSAGNLVDADGDTTVQVEEAADDDTIRFDTAGAERMIINATGQIGVGTSSVSEDASINVSKTHQVDADATTIFIDTVNTPTVAMLTDINNYTSIKAVMSGTANEDIGSNFRGNMSGGTFILNYDHLNTGDDLRGDSRAVSGVLEHKGSGLMSEAYGGRFTASSRNNGGDFSTVSGVNGTVSIENNATAGTANGIHSIVRTVDAGSAITNAIGLSANIYGSGGSITNGYGLLSRCADADTCYGLYIGAGDAEVTADQDWGIYATGEDKNYLSGKLGIGDSTPDGTLKLDVEGQIGATEYCDEDGANCTTAAALASGVSSSMEDADGDTKIQVEEAADDDTIRFDTAGTERMTIDSNGYVGIGTTNPYQPFHLVAATSTSSDTSALFSSSDDHNHVRIDAPTDYHSILAFSENDILKWRLSNYGDGDDKLTLRNAASVSTIAFLQDGTMGIGDTTPDGTLLLDVEGQIGATEYCDEDGANCTTAAALASGVSSSMEDADGDTKIQVEEAADDDTIRFDTAGTERLFINDDGKIRIGTNDVSEDALVRIHSPSNSILRLSSTGGPWLHMVNESDSSGSAILVFNNPSQQWNVSLASADGSLADNDFAISDITNSLTSFIIKDATGQVGIADSTPDGTLKLDVEGQIGATEYCDEDGANCTTAAALASGVSSSMEDADGDTKIQVEEAADDDTIRFDTAGVQRMTIDDGGLKIKSGPSTVLSINTAGAVATAPDIHFDSSGLIAADNDMHFNIDSDNNETDKAFIFRKNALTNAGTELMRIQEDGKVAIGTDTDGTLTITGAPDIGSANNAGDGGLVIQSATGDATGTKMRFDTNEIQTSTDGAATDLYLNSYGGHVVLAKNNAGASNIDMGAGKIIDLDDPTSAQDAATKAYVDAQVSAYTLVQDADGDTKIQVEEAADEDIIRFDTAGVERMTLDSNGNFTVNIGPTQQTEFNIKAADISIYNTDRCKSNSIGDTDPSGYCEGLGRAIVQEHEDVLHINYQTDFDGGTNIQNEALIIQSNRDVSVDTDTLFVDSSSNAVGIGTDTPNAALDVTSAGIRLNAGRKISANVTNGHLSLFGGTTDDGANIELYGSTDATVPNEVFLDADKHSFRSADASETFMNILSNGNVGIGTDTPSELLHLSSQASHTSLMIEADPDNNDESLGAYLKFKIDGGAEQSAIWSGTIDAANDNSLVLANSVSVNGGIRFATNDSVPFTNAITRMFIDTDGQIGIGDLTPNGTLLLDVEGQIGATEYCDEDGANCTTAAALASGVSSSMADADNDTKIQVEETADDDTIRFDTAGVERLIINDAGRVGIGLGADLTESMFNLNSNSGDNIDAVLIDGGGDAAGEDVFIAKGRHASAFAGDVIRAEVNRSSSTAFNFISTVMDADGTPSYPFTVRGDGKVGIGTDDPENNLQISGSGTTLDVESQGSYAVLGGTVYDDATSSVNFIGFKSRGTKIAPTFTQSGDTLASYQGRSVGVTSPHSGAGMYIKASENHGATTMGSQLHLSTVSNGNKLPTPRLTITESGDVGIGTDTPTSALTVQRDDGSAAILAVNTEEDFSIIAASVYNDAAYTANFIGYRNRGTIDSPAFSQTGDVLANFQGRTQGVTSPLSGAGMQVTSTENHSAAVMGSELTFHTVPNGTKLASERMSINEAGKVAIGTDTDGTLTITGAPDISSANTAGEGAIVIQSATGDATGTKMRIETNEIQTSTNGSASPLLINAYGGDLSLGHSNPGSSNFDMNTGTIYALANPTSAQDAATKNYVDVAVSDRRLKTEIVDMDDYGIDTVMALRPVNYLWKDPTDIVQEGKQFGFIAQEIGDVIPELIVTKDDEMKTVTYKHRELTSILTKAVQQIKELYDDLFGDVEDLKAQNKTLQAEVETLKSQNIDILKRLEALEAAKAE